MPFYRTHPEHEKNHMTIKLATTIAIKNIRGVSSDAMMAVGPDNSPQPSKSVALASWKDHHAGFPRFKKRSPLTISIICMLVTQLVL